MQDEELEKIKKKQLEEMLKNQKESKIKQETEVLELDSTNFDLIIASSNLVLVDFWAEWCGPCRMIAPVIEELAVEFEGRAKICKVNTDQQQELSMRFGIRSIPTILFLKDGEIVDTMIGAASKQAFAEKLESLL